MGELPVLIDAKTQRIRTLAAAGEALVAARLVREGWHILERNWHGRGAEIDIVAREGNTVVFVEVKTRRSNARGSALESVTSQKFMRFRRAACKWLIEHDQVSMRARLDVVAVKVERVGKHQWQIAHYEHLRGVSP